MITLNKSLFVADKIRTILSGKRSPKAIGVFLCLSGLFGVTFPTFVHKAQASTACSAVRIAINTGFGAEPPTVVSGHRHWTGNHYVKYTHKAQGGYIWIWYADNNGGLDGDTADSYYDYSFCSGRP